MKQKSTLLIAIIFILSFSLNAQNYFHSRINQQAKQKHYINPLPKQKNVKEAVIFSENFDEWPLAGWSFYELGDTVGWTDLISIGSSSGGYQGPNAAIHMPRVLTGCDDWMISPAITITDEGTILSFWEHLSSGGQYAKHQVIVLDGTNPETANILDTVYENINHDVSYWEEVSVSLGSFINKTIYI